jgi:hypothetical protein
MNVQPQGAWYLSIIGGPMAGQTYFIASSIMTIGRSDENDIMIDAPGVSKQHAQLTFQDGWFYITDLSSRNGVYINGLRIDAPQPVQLGDQVMLSSEVTFVLEWVPASEQSIEPGAAVGYAPIPPQGAPPAQWQIPPQSQQPEPAYQQKPASTGAGMTLLFVGCGLILFVVAVVGIGGALVYTNVIPNPFATPTPSPTWTATMTPFVPTSTPTLTPTPTPTTVPTSTPYPTYTLYPTFTPEPTLTATHTPSPTPAPTETATPTFTPLPTQTPVPTNTPRPTNTPVPPTRTRTPTPTQRPPTPTPTPAAPLTLDWSLADARCVSKTAWVAVFRITVNGGGGQYTYFRDIDQIHGPTNDPVYVYELQYGMSAAVGTFKVRSGNEEASKGFWVPHPDCSSF